MVVTGEIKKTVLNTHNTNYWPHLMCGANNKNITFIVIISLLYWHQRQTRSDTHFIQDGSQYENLVSPFQGWRLRNHLAGIVGVLKLKLSRVSQTLGGEVWLLMVYWVSLMLSWPAQASMQFPPWKYNETKIVDITCAHYVIMSL